MPATTPTQAPLQGLSLTPPAVPSPAQGLPPAPPTTPQFDPEKLADIHLPEAISYWPVAPGWWLLLALIILAVVIILLWRKNRSRVRAITPAQKIKLLKAQASQELKFINDDYKKHGLAHKTVKRLSVFLRRYALSLYPRDRVASLTDEQWLKLLDKLSYSELYSQKFSELLTTVPYQPEHNSIDTELLSQLFTASKRLLETPHQETEHV